MADPFPPNAQKSAPRGPTIRPDAARVDLSSTPYTDADLWRAVDELQAASRHFTAAVDLLKRELATRQPRAPRPYPAGQPFRDRAPPAEFAATLKPGETR
jgi:hypothetical protein